MGLLVLLALQAAIVLTVAACAQGSSLQHDRTSTSALPDGLDSAAAGANSRRLLDRLLEQQQQQTEGVRLLQQQEDEVIVIEPVAQPGQVPVPAGVLPPGQEEATIIINPPAAVITPPGTTVTQPTLPVPPVQQQPQQPAELEPKGPYCIPRGPNGLAVLAAGDSITQGSVPSKNLNHPFTIRMEQVLEQNLGTEVRALDAGLGGGGVFMTGFNVPVTFGPWLDTYMGQGPWNLVVMMIGINDLLRGGKPAQEIMDGLVPMIDKVLAARTPVILMPPFAAPGFVQENDSKEGERKKLAGLFRSYCTAHAARTGGIGPQVWMLDLQASPFDFYPMPPSERSKWLDDGLHMTELAYDTIGDLVAAEIARRVCPAPTTATNNQN